MEVLDHMGWCLGRNGLLCLEAESNVGPCIDIVFFFAFSITLGGKRFLKGV